MRGSTSRSSSRASATASRSGITGHGSARKPTWRRSRMLPNVSPGSSGAPHVPVLAREVSDLLDLRPGDTVVDCTFGAGGHAAMLEPQLEGTGTYIAVDRDPDVRPYFDA